MNPNDNAESATEINITANIHLRDFWRKNIHLGLITIPLDEQSRRTLTNSHDKLIALLDKYSKTKFKAKQDGNKIKSAKAIPCKENCLYNIPEIMLTVKPRMNIIIGNSGMPQMPKAEIIIIKIKDMHFIKKLKNSCIKLEFDL